MVITDSIYGDFRIDEVIQELIDTDTVQRLKNIHQGGASFLVNPEWNVTRYEHSIGTMLLIKQLGGSIEEQIAGLLHDISHTAFSHVIDFVLKNDNENYHEQIYTKVVENSEIPAILKKYGFDSKFILEDDTKWTLLEQSAPSLCADRVDYTLRDMFHYGFITIDEISEFLINLKVVNGEIMLSSLDKAEWFVDVYYKEVINFFMHPLNIYAYDTLSKALQLALEKKILTLADFLNDDFTVFALLENSIFEDIRLLTKSLNPNVNVVENKSSYDIHLVNKLRLIDPNLYIDNIVSRSSVKSKFISTLSEKAHSKSLEGSYIKVL